MIVGSSAQICTNVYHNVLEQEAELRQRYSTIQHSIEDQRSLKLIGNSIDEYGGYKFIIIIIIPQFIRRRNMSESLQGRRSSYYSSILSIYLEQRVHISVTLQLFNTTLRWICYRYMF